MHRAMLRLGALSALLLAGLPGSLLSGCSGGTPWLPPPPPYGVISGYVLTERGEPLGGATVTVRDHNWEVSGVTYPSGYFPLEDVPVGRRLITASLGGYMDWGEASAYVDVYEEQTTSLENPLRLVRVVDGAVYLADLRVTGYDNWGWPQPAPGQLQLSGITYLTSAIGSVSVRGTQASPAYVRYNLGRRAARLVAMVGVDDRESNIDAEVVFDVIADGQTLFTSPPLKVGETASIDVPVANMLTLDLRVRVIEGTAGWDEYISVGWGDARLVLP